MAGRDRRPDIRVRTLGAFLWTQANFRLSTNWFPVQEPAMRNVGTPPRRGRTSRAALRQLKLPAVQLGSGIEHGLGEDLLADAPAAVRHLVDEDHDVSCVPVRRRI